MDEKSPKNQDSRPLKERLEEIQVRFLKAQEAKKPPGVGRRTVDNQSRDEGGSGFVPGFEKRENPFK